MTGCNAPTIHPETSIEVQISDKGFTPDVLYVPTGKEIKITLINSTQEDHNWIILADSYVNPYLQGPPDVYFEVEVPAGKTIYTSFNSPKSPIQLDVVCENEECIKAGMNSLLVVVEK
jgi:plastocyanin